MKYLIIKVDTNDADYVSNINKISDEDILAIMPLINALKAFSDANRWEHNYPRGECHRPDMGEKSVKELYPDITEETFDIFNGFLPSTEYGFHTIESIDVIEGTMERLF